MAKQLLPERFEVRQPLIELPGRSVVLAHDRTRDQLVKISLQTGLSADAAARLEQRATALLGAGDDRLAHHVACGVTEHGAHYLVEDWLEGPTLADHLAGEAQALAVDLSLGLVRSLAEALGPLHRQGVVHGDVRPANIILAPDLQQVKLTGFGQAGTAGWSLLPARPAEPAGDGSAEPQLCFAGYLAPEQARGEQSITPAADVFALGCVLYECLTGRPAFASVQRTAMLIKLLLEPAPRLRDVRRGISLTLSQLVARLLAKDPTERPADGLALARELRLFAAYTSDHSRTAISSLPALTSSEQQLISIVVGAPSTSASPAQPAESGDRTQHELAALREAVSQYNAEVHRLVDGSFVATLRDAPVPTEHARLAARCALAVRVARPGTPVALATGRDVFKSCFAGSAIERAVAKLDEGTAAAVQIDELTAGLLDTRFDVRSDGKRLTLHAQRAVVESVRTLLGRPTDCIGRTQELQALHECFAACVAERRARAVLGTGPPGIGKSRLRFEFVRRLRRQESALEVLTGYGDMLNAGSAYGLIGTALRRWIGIEPDKPLEIQRHRVQTRIGRHLDEGERGEISAFIGELTGVHFDDATSYKLRAARSDARLMADQVRSAFIRWLNAETANAPVLLILDDLDWGDRPTVQLVDAALGGVNGPFMVLALATPEVHQRFNGLWSGRTVDELPLKPLPREDCLAVAKQVLGRVLSSSALEQLAERSGGNAFYLEELIRSVAEGKGEKAPETVLGMVQARLASLEPEARRILRAASVFGDRFQDHGVASLLGGERELPTVRRWFQELVRRELITRHDDDFGFAHGLVHDAAYAMLTDSDRALAHRLAGRWLEQSGEHDPLTLAEHFQRGGQNDKALAQYTRAAQEALEGNDLEAVMERVDRGVACGPSDEQLGILRLLQSDAYYWQSRYFQAESCAIEAATRFGSARGAAWFRAVERIIDTTSRLGQEDECITWIANLSQAVPDDEAARRAQAYAQARAARTRLFTGDYEAAGELIALAGAVAEATDPPDPLLTGRLQEAQSLQASCLGDLCAAVSCDAYAVECFELAGDERSACNAKANLGFFHLEIGALQAAQGVLEEALAAALELGLTTTAAVAQHNLGLVLARLGRIDEALEMETLAARAFQRSNSIRLEGAARCYLAHVLIAGDDPVAAEEQARRAVELLEGFSSSQVEAHAALAHALLRQGRAAAARAAAEDAMQMLSDLGAIEGGESLVRLIYAETLIADGEEQAGREVLLQARARLLKRAEQIADESTRESFLCNLWENARTLELSA